MNGEQNSEKEKAIAEYRNALLEGDKVAVQGYDKAVMTLSGGAIAISFAFIKDICGFNDLVHSGLLLCAWGVWGFSILCVLVSHYCSHQAMRRALIDLNNNNLKFERPGRGWDTAINILNPVGGLLFLVGLISLLVFVSLNFGHTKAEYLDTSGKIISTTVTTTTTNIIFQTGTNVLITSKPSMEIKIWPNQ